MCPRDAQDRPEGAQEGPRSAPEVPKSGQQAPKSAQEVPKRRPGGIQNPRKAGWRARNEFFVQLFVARFTRKAPGTIFRGFSADFCVWRKSANLEFYRPCRRFKGFFKDGRCSSDVIATQEKTSKNKARGPPKPSPDVPKTLQNRPRGAWEHQKTGRDVQDWLAWLHKWPMWAQWAAEWLLRGIRIANSTLWLAISLASRDHEKDYS